MNKASTLQSSSIVPSIMEADGAGFSPKRILESKIDTDRNDDEVGAIREAEYIGSFPVSGSNQDEQTEYVRRQLLEMKATTYTSKSVLLVVSLSGIKVFCKRTQSVLMAHALKRISYATCYPEQCQFSFLAREPCTSTNSQNCHAFRLFSAPQAEELNEIVAMAFKMAYTILRNSTAVVGDTPTRRTGFRDTWRRRNDEETFDSYDLQEKDTLPCRSEISASVGQLVSDGNQQRRKEREKRLPQSSVQLAHQTFSYDAPLSVADRSGTMSALPSLTQSPSRLHPKSTTDVTPQTRAGCWSPFIKSVEGSPRYRPTSGKYDNEDATSRSRQSIGLKNESNGLYQGPPTPARFNSTQYVNNTRLNASTENSLLEASWYQPKTPREVALEKLSQEDIGSFIVRDSTTHAGCYALSVKVPKYDNPSGISHYLISRTSKNTLKIKGLEKEWPSISALVIHHTVMREQLPCLLQLPPSHSNDIKRADSIDDRDSF